MSSPQLRTLYRVRSFPFVRYISINRDGRPTNLVKNKASGQFQLENSSNSSRHKSFQKKYLPIFCDYIRELLKKGKSPHVDIASKSYLEILRNYVTLLFSSLYEVYDQSSNTTMEPVKGQLEDLNFDCCPPKSVRGMTSLDKEAFKRTVNVAGVLFPKASIGKQSKKLKKIFFSRKKLKNIVDIGKDDPLYLSHKIVLFDPLQVKTMDDISEDIRAELVNLNVNLETFSVYNIPLEYENWSHTEILDAILPEALEERVSSFAVIGHIAHLNLREDTLPFKNIIGEVILSQFQNIQTVVNKIGIIENEYRVSKMEVIAGENNFVTTVREHGFTYSLDYSKVYWNSKLGTEHQRIVGMISPGDIVYDVFAGIGPFAIPAAKKGGIVFANDLNPSSYESLCVNKKANKIKKGELYCYNLDGREFVRTIVKQDLQKQWQKHNVTNDKCVNPKIHIVMNLPALAIEFLDSFISLYQPSDLKPSTEMGYPFVHCYCFSSEVDLKEDVKKRVESILQHPLPEDHIIRMVRNVAPSKEMLCITFQLTPKIMFGDVDSSSESSDEPPAEKKCKLENQSE